MGSDPKTIAVLLDETGASRARLGFACDVALAFRAHVAAIFIDAVPGAVRDEDAPVLFSRGVGIDDAIDRYFHLARESIEGLRRDLEAWATEHDLSSTWRHVPLYASLKDIAIRCMGAELLVLPPLGFDSTSQPWTSPAIVLASGVPGILVPGGPPRGLPRHVAIAWNSSRVARRAVGDAIPFLERADRVTIVVIDAHARPSSEHADAGSELATMLARRGISSAVKVVPADGVATSEVLVRCAEGLEADLLVAGAYGHSRMVEIALGSTTRALLRHDRLPFFISH